MFVSRVLGAATGGYLEGYGGRKANNGTRMQGMTAASLRHHVALQPLFLIIGAGIFGPLDYILCLDMGSLNIPLSPLISPNFLKEKILPDFLYPCCLVPMTSYEGMTMVTAMIIRAATKATDVNWSKNKEVDYHVNHYKEKQYKFLNVANNPTDLSKPSPVPDYKN